MVNTINPGQNLDPMFDTKLSWCLFGVGGNIYASPLLKFWNRTKFRLETRVLNMWLLRLLNFTTCWNKFGASCSK